MSLRAKATLSLTCLATAGIVTFVHWAQQSEKAAMHAGVVRDIENQRIRNEREADFAMQRRLEEEYRKVQTVSGPNGGGEGLKG